MVEKIVTQPEQRCDDKFYKLGREGLLLLKAFGFDNDANKAKYRKALELIIPNLFKSRQSPNKGSSDEYVFYAKYSSTNTYNMRKRESNSTEMNKMTETNGRNDEMNRMDEKKRKLHNLIMILQEE